MEITINIPKNDYVQPTEVRQEVVQVICDYMLDNDGCGRVFHPKPDGCYRSPNIWLRRKEGTKRWNGLCRYDSAHEEGYENTRIHGSEMQAAFKALQDAGYYMFRIYEYRTWLGYRCSKKPFLDLDSGTRVTEFTDFID